MTSSQVLAPPDRHVAAPTSRARVVVLGLAAVTAWSLLRTGPGFVPGVREQASGLTDWPHIAVTDATSYMLRLPLGPVVYKYLPHTVEVFILLHAAALFVSGCLLLVWLLRRYGSQTGTVATAVLLLSPLTSVLVEWVGIYDAFSMLTWVLLLMVLARHRAWQVAAGFLAGVQNFEQVAVGLVLLALLPEVSRGVRWRPWTPGLLAGALAGRVLLETYLRSEGVPGGSRLSFILGDLGHFLDMTTGFLLNVPLVLAASLGGLWAFALPALRRTWADPPGTFRVRLAAVVVLLLGVGAVGADHTRVMVMSAVPLLVAGAVLVGEQQATFGAFWRRTETWLLLLFPPVVFFGDIVLPLGVRYDPALWFAY